MLKLVDETGITSPILKEHVEKTKSMSPKKKKILLEEFWSQRDGPLIEEIENEKDHYLVTFLYQEPGLTEELRVSCQAFGHHFPHREIMHKVKDQEMDIYYKSVYVFRGSFLTYHFTRGKVDVPGLPGIKPIGKNKPIPDPLNTERFDIDIPDFPEQNFSISALKMPDFQEKQWIIEIPDVPRGKLTELTIEVNEEMREAIDEKKKKMEEAKEKQKEEMEDPETEDEEENEDDPYNYKFVVYTPSEYSEDAEPYPFLLMFDGIAYNNKTLVNTPLILDNLIVEKKILPMVALFVYHKNRNEELLMNEKFGRYIAKTVLPRIQENYNIASDPKKTVCGGSSFSGIMSMYMGLNYPDIFGKIICQSGSFWAGDNIENINNPSRANYLYLINEFKNKEKVDLDIYMEIGRYEGQESSLGRPSHYYANLHMHDVLELKGYEFRFEIFNGGHDYFYWRYSLGDALIHLLNK